MKKRPVVITQGDPAGVGPEITLQAFSHRQERETPWLWVGDPDLLSWVAEQMQLPKPAIHRVKRSELQSSLTPNRLHVLPTEARIGLDQLQFGQPRGENAHSVVESIRTAADLAMRGLAGAVVTPPINKAVLHAGGYGWPGHTELLGEVTGVHEPVMMLAGRGLRVVPATIHQSIQSVPQSLNQAQLTRLFLVVEEAMRRDFGLRSPRIAICGLNPHCGEGGAFGDEEGRIIAPAIAAAHQERGGEEFLFGPFPADSLFSEAARAPYDVIICMYHDQALIPIKMHAFGEAVNITLGLPIIRTSVDHGTAYDIAGQGRADYHSLLIALEQASEMSANRQVWQSSLEKSA
uniref:4-hydroxythreonine-4-phosphate dehydrogenase n=1 Tax=Magnetococcus massalia (strain MO-1) TaxID=451514 RepID=A0A1S7LI05_MAGMO|nr:4-hydroxythreonine-4-phosphate dehydrogenase (4-(phosphohydroxy)-L-threonine dehydrogenase) [Candidatus Magnetococcus massalia]